MKLLHISDLHLGKDLGSISLLEDQRYILMDQILPLIKRKKVDALLISGDIFDRVNVSADDISLYDDFVKEVSNLNVKMFVIAGNHDSRERISQLKEILCKGQYYVSSFYKGKIDKVSLSDEYGPINIYLLPFITYHDVDQYYKVEYNDERKYDSALKKVMENENIDTTVRNVILSHQLVLNSLRSPSESSSISLNVSDEVSIDNYKDFDYVALGHIHKAMVKDNGRIVYPGAVLPYHKDESNDRYVSYVELNKKGDFHQELIKIEPKRKIIKVVGDSASVLKHSIEKDNFVVVVLDDDSVRSDIESRLNILFPNLISIDRKSSSNIDIDKEYTVDQSLSPLETIKDFIKQRLGEKYDDSYSSLIDQIYEKTINN